MKNNKGMMIELLMLITVGFIVLLFFAGWKYGFNLVNTELVAIQGDAGENSTNISDVTQKTMGYINTGLDELGTIAFIIIFGYSLAVLIVGYFARDHPALMFVYVLIVALFVVFSVYISNSYEELLTNDVIGSTLSSYSLGSFFMTYLTTWIIIIGLIGATIAISGIIKNREFER